MHNAFHIVLITSGQPALNPRLVKEADTLASSGYKVTVIYQFWNAWGTEIDQQILPQKKWKAIRVGGSLQEKKALYWLTRIRHKAAKSFIKLFGFKFKLAEQAANRSTFLLIKEALRQPANLYIAHNLAALPAAVLAAKKNQTKCGFDAEDFHRNEVYDDPNHPDVLLKKFLEDQYIPQTDYLTTSSFNISKFYEKLYPSKKAITILNAFPIVKEVPLPTAKAKYEPLKLFWFSQNIGLNRGLQNLFSALKLLGNEQIELHLLGFLDAETKLKLEELIAGFKFKMDPNIVFHPPIHPDQLPVFASQFDVGLAAEPAFCLNNNIALSNKIFTYVQAGLAVVASDTMAQQQFITENPKLGFCYEKGNAQQLAVILKSFIDDSELLLKTKREAYFAARNNLNWETESLKFLKIVEQTLEN